MGDGLAAAQSLGLTLPGPGYLLGMVVFSLLGFAAWRYGKRTERPRTKWLGVALMFYTYVVWTTWLVFAVGLALCAAIWWDLRGG
ncbi:MAG: hypothetical protein V4505_13265 [Pseudomonadota bacterium]